MCATRSALLATMAILPPTQSRWRYPWTQQQREDTLTFCSGLPIANKRIPTGHLSTRPQPSMKRLLEVGLSKLPLLYTKASLNNASLNGEIGVLDWWARESGLPLRFSQAAVDLGSSGGHLPILRWWWDAYATGAIDRFLFSRSAMMRASANSHLTTLDWWKMIASTHATTDRPVVLIYDSALVLRTAVARNKRDVFEWWVASGLLVMERVESGDDDDWVRSTCVPYEHSKDIEWLRAWKTLRDARLGGVATTVPLPAADDDDDLIDRVPVPGPVPVTHERIDSGTEDEDSAKLLLDVVSHHQDDHVPAESGIAPAHVSVADLAPAAAGPADVTDVDVEVIGAVDPATIPLPTDDTGLDDGLADWPANHEADAEAGQEAVDADENASVAGSEDLNTSHDSDEEEETESEVDPMEKLPRIWRYDNNLIDDASREGALDVLDFMLANHKSDPVNWPFLLSDDALDYCCRDGMIDTSIKWFYDAYARGDLSREKLDAATSGWGLHFATRENHIHVLDFFAAHGMKLETKAHTLDTSSCSLETLSWWRDHKHLHCPGYSETAVDNASSSEDLERLAWWRDSGMEFKYSEEAIDEASREGRVSVLSWWLNESGIPHDQLKYSDKSVDDALKNDHWEILLWWRASGLPIKYTEEALYHVSDEGNVRALQWLLCCSLETGLLLKFERERVLQSFANDAVGQFWSALLLG
ncbi:hypothetical protein BC828DRAFT_127831 [Blastocladiella britannica]|nr:hypothetical protein BC828DRAFT_127831 [Blastocladiella britannica]